MKDSLGRDPWWNADRCAPLRRGARPWPMPRQKSLASVGVSLPTFAFVLTRSPVFPFVMPGLDPGIHVESTPAQRTPPALAGGSSAWTTGIGVRRTPFCERLCPVVTSQRPWLAMARALRCAARTRFRASLRAQRSNPVSGAALDCFVAFAPRNDEGAAMRRENEIFSLPPTCAQRVVGRG